MLRRISTTLSWTGIFVKELAKSNWFLILQPVLAAIAAAGGITFSDLTPNEIADYVRLMFDPSPSGTDAMVHLKQRNEHVSAIPLFLVTAPLLICFLVLARFGLVASSEASSTSALRWRVFVIIVVAFFAVLLLPLLFAMIASIGGIQVFTCAMPRMRDFTWLVFDSLAKGALLDVLESFHVDLYTDRCHPNKESWATSSIILLMRLFSTYVLVWFAISSWRSALAWARRLWAKIRSWQVWTPTIMRGVLVEQGRNLLNGLAVLLVLVFSLSLIIGGISLLNVVFVTGFNVQMPQGLPVWVLLVLMLLASLFLPILIVITSDQGFFPLLRIGFASSLVYAVIFISTLAPSMLTDHALRHLFMPALPEGNASRFWYDAVLAVATIVWWSASILTARKLARSYTLRIEQLT